MGDAEPPRSYVTEVVVPTSVPEPFDFGDDAFSFGAGDDGIARVLDDPGYLLGVERNAGKASKAAPTAFANSRHAGYRGPSEATEAAKAAQQAVADELDLLADGREPFFAEEESLGVLIGTIGGSRPSKLVAAAKAIELDAKAARRATEMKRYGRGARPGTAFGSSSSRHKQASLPKSIYSQDVLVRTQKKVERELRETNARAPFITAQYGVKLPAPVSAMQIGDASAKARARRAALSAAKSVQHQRPFSAGPLRSFDRDESFREPTLGVWRVNANVRHDVTDPISVSFQDAKRARAVAALRAKEERDRRDPNGFRPPRVDRSKYPSLKTFLGAQQQRTREVREQMPGYVDAARVAAAKTREADYSRKAKETSGVLLSPGETQELSYGQTVNAVAGNAPVDTENAPALRAFIQLTETFRSGSLSADAGDMERALMVAAADAAKEAVELAAAAAAKTALAAADDDQDAVALIAEGIAEAVYEDTQMLKQVEGVVTPTRHTVPGAFILGQNPRGSPRSLFGPAAFSGGEKHEVPGAKKNIQEPFLTAEEQVVQQLAAMTPEQRNAARAKASKGWSGDFTGVFYEQAGAAPPTWNEKPAVSEPSPSVGGDAEAFDKSLDATDGDVDALAVTFIGPNAAELAFRAVHPDAPKEVTEEAAQKRRDEMKNAYKSPNELAAAEAAQKACEGLDPTDPATVQDVKQRLAEMGIVFFGTGADALAFKAAFPEHAVPTVPKTEGADAEKGSNTEKDSKIVLTKPVPLSHVTGAAGLAVRFIGGNAEALTKQALDLDDELDADARKNPVTSSDAEAAELADALPSTPEKTANETSEEPSDQAPFSDPTEPLSSAQEQAWSRAGASVPGKTSASPFVTAANAADVETASAFASSAEISAELAAEALLKGDDAVTEAFANEAFPLEHETVIDAGSGATVPTSLVAPLADENVRDASGAGGAPDFTKDILERAEAIARAATTITEDTRDSGVTEDETQPSA